MDESAFAIGDQVTISREIGELSVGGAAISHGDIGQVIGICEQDVYDVDFAGYLVEGLPLQAGGVTVIEPAGDGVDPVDTIFGRD